MGWRDPSVCGVVAELQFKTINGSCEQAPQHAAALGHSEKLGRTPTVPKKRSPPCLHSSMMVADWKPNVQPHLIP